MITCHLYFFVVVSLCALIDLLSSVAHVVRGRAIYFQRGVGSTVPQTVRLCFYLWSLGPLTLACWEGEPGGAGAGGGCYVCDVCALLFLECIVSYFSCFFFFNALLVRREGCAFLASATRRAKLSSSSIARQVRIPHGL